MTKEDVRVCLHRCVDLALKDILPYEQTDGSDKKHQPMDNPEDLKTLHDGIDWLADTYEDKIIPGCMAGTGYYIRINGWEPGHPVFLLGTLYTLLLADANIYIDYERSWMRLEDEDITLTIRILDTFTDMALIKEPVCYIEQRKRYPYEALEELFIRQHPDIRHKVFMNDCGDSAVRYARYERYKDRNLALHIPGAHFVLTDYGDAEHVAADNKFARFREQYQQELMDCEVFHGQGDAVACMFKCSGYALGLPYSIYEKIQVSVKEWCCIKEPKDKQVILVFTDKCREDIQLPEQTEECCAVILGEDWNCGYPQYDFLQLIQC